jgi:hypothetical protein
MSFPEFKVALDTIAVMLFSEEFDRNGTLVSPKSRTVEEKRGLLMDYIKLGNADHFASVRNSYYIAFASSIPTNSRTPDNDLSKSYKYRDCKPVLRRI